MNSEADDQSIRADISRLTSRMEGFFGGVERQIIRSASETYSQVEALVGLYRELDGRLALPPMRKWALSPDSARILRQHVVSTEPSLIVELGSGVSTLLLAVLLEQMGGTRKVVALEHDPVFYAETRLQLARQGLGDRVELVYAPICDHVLGDETMRWYEADALASLSEIDLVVVDGPPDGVGDRFAAYPLLRDHCAAGCSFFIDDYIRDREQTMVTRWVDEYGAVLREHSESAEKWVAIVDTPLGRNEAESIESMSSEEEGSTDHV